MLLGDGIDLVSTLVGLLFFSPGTQIPYYLVLSSQSLIFALPPSFPPFFLPALPPSFTSSSGLQIEHYNLCATRTIESEIYKWTS